MHLTEEGNVQPLSLDQVEVKVNQRRRQQVTNILFLSLFIDIAGALFLAPAYPTFVSQADGAVAADSTSLDAFPNSAMMGIPYALALNLITVCNMAGGFIGTLATGILTDKIGKKPVILGCLLGGAISFVIQWIAGALLESYLLFLVGQFFNGLFSGTRVAIPLYLQDIYEGAEYMKIAPLQMMIQLLGGAGGVAVTAIVSAITKGRVWPSAIVGAVLTMICFLSILLYVPTAPGDTAKGIKKGPKEETEEIFTPKLVKVILRIIIIGSFLDTFGDTGNRFARSTIMTNRFTQDPENARNPNLQFVFLLSNLAAVMIGVQLVSQTWKKLGLPLWACIGNLVSSVTQFVLIFVVGPPGSGAMWWFFSIWFCSQCFGFTSSMATRLMIPMITPAETRGQWTSYFAAGASLSGLVAPLMLAGIYDKFGPTSGNFVGPEVCLTMCGSISFVAFLIFTPLFGLWPKDVLGKVVPTNVEDLEYYDKMHWREFEKLDHEIKLYVHEMCVKAGRVWSKQTHWGDYKDDVADMEGLRKRSLKQFFDTRKLLTGVLTNRKKLMESQERDQKMMRDKDGNLDRYALFDDIDGEAREMGLWIRDYFQDAGYTAWPFMPHLFKMMIVNAFPPMEELDGKMFDHSHSVVDYEKFILKWLTTLEKHSGQKQQEERWSTLSRLGDLARFM